jgi:SpoVK/Ycf46/Vps4 family AAA+-type ATPase
MATPRQFSRQNVIDVLNRAGYRELAEEASRVLPDPVDVDQLAELGMQYGVTRDDLISRMGGSP